MKFKISKEVFEKFPEAVIGIIVAERANNSGENVEINEILQNSENEVREKFSAEQITKIPEIVAWRNAYSAFGAKPSDYRSSIEALLRRLLNGKNLPRINKIVDLYNYISIKYLVPAGGEDLDKIDGDILLTFADGSENFIALGEGEITHPKKGEVIYTDNKEVLCRRWNWRESEKTKFTETTKNAFLCVEALPPTNREKIQNILNELASLVEKYCNTKTKIFILSKENPAEEIFTRQK